MLWKRTLAVLVVALAAVPAFGQAQGGGGGGAGGGGGRRGNFDPAQMRQRMEERLKEELGASDDEWKALQPKIEKVMELERDANGGRRGMFGRGRRGGPGGDQATPTPTPPSSPVQEKAQALQKVLDNKDAKPEEVKSALQAYRAARADAKQQLAKAQDDLRGLLTARQESVLVMFGMLE